MSDIMIIIVFAIILIVAAVGASFITDVYFDRLFDWVVENIRKSK
jgi:hypothetical protein